MVAQVVTTGNTDSRHFVMNPLSFHSSRRTTMRMYVGCFEEFTLRELHRTEAAQRSFAGSRLKSAGLTAHSRSENGKQTLMSGAREGRSSTSRLSHR